MNDQPDSRCRARRAAALGIGLALGLLVDRPAQAWYTLTHPLLTEAAFTALPAEMQTTFAPALAQIKLGSMLPDGIGDWANHEMDLHPRRLTRPQAISHLEDAAATLVERLRADPLASGADLGTLLHYAQDLLHPLHTDDDPRETDALHQAQEQATYDHRARLQAGVDLGVRLWPDVSRWAESAIPRANRLYAPWLEAAIAGQDSLPLAQRSFALAVRETRDLWVSLWYQARPDLARHHLHINRGLAQPQQLLQLFFSPADAEQEALALSWLDAESGAILSSWTQSVTAGQAWIQAPEQPGHYRLHLDAGSDQDAVRLQVIAQRPFFDLRQLQPLGYVLDARWPGSPLAFRQLLQPWDLFGVGGNSDDPPTDNDEELDAAFIPGPFSHLILYLGRNSDGDSIGMEMSQDHWREIHQFRVITLPEGTLDEAPDHQGLPWVEVSLERRAWRWSRPFTAAQRARILGAAGELLARMQADWEDAFPYQLEYDWSGELTDYDVWLVDDGWDGGASCTDYWLTLFEEVAGVCVSGSRMTAAEFSDYFRTDPIASKLEIPPVLNPLPFPLRVQDILDLGYRPIDPPPHVFQCDDSEGDTETGVPLPSRFITSADLASPRFLPNLSVLSAGRAEPWRGTMTQLLLQITDLITKTATTRE